MQVGMTLPVMEPDLPSDLAGILEAWSRTIDAGPFSSLCFGERMAFDNPDASTLLGAVAAWTSRVRVTTTVVVPQLHHPVLLAKSLATADQLCRGRLSVGVGVGGRDEDYRVVDADLGTKRMGVMADAVATMRAVWAGERVADAVRPVGPPPVRDGGPEILVGTMGERTVRHAAGWADGLAGVTVGADGLAGVTLAADAAEVDALFRLARDAWAEVGRAEPRLTTSFWFAVGDDPRGQVHRHLRHYMNWLPPDLVDALAATAGFAGTPAELRDHLKRFEDTGCDEVHLIPTTSDLSQVERIAEIL